MNDHPELSLKKLCCTCLSQDRKLKQLCRLTEGVNNLYHLLSSDTEAYREGFFKETTSWYICWECWAVMDRITTFRRQACAAQHQLVDILEGRLDNFEGTLSRLSTFHKINYDVTETYIENFVDCSLRDSDDDVPLSELRVDCLADDMDYPDHEIPPQELDKENSEETKIHKKRKKIKNKSESVKKNKPKHNKDKKYFTKTEMTEAEMCESRTERKMATGYTDANVQCEPCVKGFNSQNDYENHVIELHTEKDNHTKCNVCQIYVHSRNHADHVFSHRLKYTCSLCEVVAFSLDGVMQHITEAHDVTDSSTKYSTREQNLESKRRGRAPMDKRTPLGYKCAECDTYFQNKNLRWKHVQKQHREGYKCGICDKRFAFKNNLARHQLSHGAIPRVPCPLCRKQVRTDLARAHARLHAPRDTYTCVECDTHFVSRASYEHHLKYTARHAQTPVNKYKCETCGKGYRSRAELRDHINYQHMGKTCHKCPVCDKGLATPRCVTRHVRRAHHGVKEQPRDKVCQQCGRTFRDKKTLLEHELIHSGLRPLSCEVCGCTFRQSASLYTHRRRVHARERRR